MLMLIVLKYIKRKEVEVIVENKLEKAKAINARLINANKVYYF